MIELQEAAELVYMEPSGDETTAFPHSTRTRPPRVSAKNMILELRRSTDLLLGLAAGARTEQSGCLDGLEIRSTVIQLKFFQLSPDTVAIGYWFYLASNPVSH